MAPAWEMGKTLRRLRVVVRARVLKANDVSVEYHPLMATFFGVVRLDRGVYGIEGLPGCVVSAVRVGACVVGLESALYLHGLLPDEPWESWLYVGHKRWKPRQSATFPIEVVRTRRTFDAEDIVKRPDGVAYTSVARTIVDFHRHRSRFLPGRAAQVLTVALGAGKTTLDEVRQTAARLRVRFP